MPFDLSGLTPEQGQRFVERLATFLHPSASRSRLMAVREAFSRAAGYPDAHALEQARSRRPAQGLDDALAWAGRAWKHHRALLATEPFGAREAEGLVAVLWGYSSWMGVTVQLDLQVRAQRPGWIHGTGGALPALAVGLDDEGPVGLAAEAWEGHVLLQDEHPLRRMASVVDWAQQRRRAGDRIVLLDGRDDGPALAGAFSGTGAAVRTLDWREGVAQVPDLVHWSVMDVTEFLVAGLRRPVHWAHEGEGNRAPMGDLVSAAHRLAVCFRAMPAEDRTLPALGALVADDVSLELERRDAWTGAFGPGGKAHGTGAADVDIVRLPHLAPEWLTDGPARRVALASAWTKHRIAHHDPSEGRRLCVAWLDVPLWARAPGWAVVYAQAKHRGATLVEAHARTGLWRARDGNAEMTAEVQASVGNLNVKFFGHHGEAPLGARPASDAPSPRLDYTAIAGPTQVRLRAR